MGPLASQLLTARTPERLLLGAGFTRSEHMHQALILTATQSLPSLRAVLTAAGQLPLVSPLVPATEDAGPSSCRERLDGAGVRWSLRSERVPAVPRRVMSRRVSANGPLTHEICALPVLCGQAEVEDFELLSGVSAATLRRLGLCTAPPRVEVSRTRPHVPFF
ncbi:MAG: hypothetical protein ACI9EF_002910 [Pseudohongiellaceae bacterium]